MFGHQVWIGRSEGQSKTKVLDKVLHANIFRDIYYKQNSLTTQLIVV